MNSRKPLNTLRRDRAAVLYENGHGYTDDICAAAPAAGRVLLAGGFPHKQVEACQSGLADPERAGLPVEH